MTIGKGLEWGHPGELAPGSAVAASDRELAQLIGAARARGEVTRPIGLAGGDLHASIGGPDPARMWTAEARHLPIDLVEVRLGDTDALLCVAHVIASGPLRWLTETLVIMNATFIDGQNLGPKAHPGDGLVDVTVGRVPLAQWWTARRRAGAGAHLPHPGLRTARVAEVDETLHRPTPVRIDGEERGRFRRIRARVIADGAIIVA